MKTLLAGLAIVALVAAFPAVAALGGGEGAVHVNGGDLPDVNPDDLEQYCNGGGSIGNKIHYRYRCDL